MKEKELALKITEAAKENDKHNEFEADAIILDLYDFFIKGEYDFECFIKECNKLNYNVVQVIQSIFNDESLKGKIIIQNKKYPIKNNCLNEKETIKFLKNQNQEKIINELLKLAKHKNLLINQNKKFTIEELVVMTKTRVCLNDDSYDLQYEP